MIGQARTAIFVWSMGVTQHEFGEDNVRAIVNLGLTKGFVGRPGCGLMPIRGHSGVQGGAEMGAYSTVLPGGRKLSEAPRFAELWGFPVPVERGRTAPEMIDAAHQGDLDVLISSGGNFLEVLPDPSYTEGALSRVPLRVHMSGHDDETSELCHWQIPETHFLESWSDGRAFGPSRRTSRSRLRLRGSHWSTGASGPAAIGAPCTACTSPPHEEPGYPGDLGRHSGVE